MVRTLAFHNVAKSFRKSHSWAKFKMVLVKKLKRKLYYFRVFEFKISSGFSLKCLKYYHNLTIFRVILIFAQECYYLENKLGVVDFTKARGMVKFQSPRALGL